MIQKIGACVFHELGIGFCCIVKIDRISNGLDELGWEAIGTNGHRSAPLLLQSFNAFRTNMRNILVDNWEKARDKSPTPAAFHVLISSIHFELKGCADIFHFFTTSCLTLIV